ncbi:unnamed protein product [Caenorhabditis bovis]|uniref:Nuclear receptor domain-containing protein n=1 Tax=Caenorhabditis bovis TaxID=2654633 RepID=A0A8S1EPH0_9PELO|nr:unnamed protein product [Caenorhabditis bovis]
MEKPAALSHPWIVPQNRGNGFGYEEPIRPINIQRPFESDMSNARGLDMNAPRPQFVPHFLPHFGLPLPEFDYRLNDFHTANLIGAYSMSQRANLPPPAFNNSAFSFAATRHLAQSGQAGAVNQPPLNPPVLTPNNPQPTHPPQQQQQQQLLQPPPLLQKEPHQSNCNEVTTTNSERLQEKPNHPNHLQSQFPFGAKRFDEKPAQFPMTKADQVNQSFTKSFLDRSMFDKPFPPNRLSEDVIFSSQTFGNGQLPVEMSSSNFLKQEIQSVCLSTHANGLHFGARTCAACAAFFRRTISDDKRYICKRNQRCTNGSREGNGYRKICRSCRMKRCLEVGMQPENLQLKRNKQNETPTRKTFEFFPAFYPNIQHNIHANIQPNLQSNLQANFQRNIQTSLPPNLQPSIPTNLQPNIQANLTTSVQNNIQPNIQQTV